MHKLNFLPVTNENKDKNISIKITVNGRLLTRITIINIKLSLSSRKSFSQAFKTNPQRVGCSRLFAFVS